MKIIYTQLNICSKVQNIWECLSHDLPPSPTCILMTPAAVTSVWASGHTTERKSPVCWWEAWEVRWS